MSQLSDTPGVARTISRYIHVPFSAFLRVDPIRGKRFETIRDLEIQANYLETLLETLCDSTDATEVDVPFDFTKPIAFTPQYGNKPARLSFHGHFCRRTTFPKAYLGDRTVIQDNQYKTGDWAANRSNRVPTAAVNDMVYNFKALLESTSGLTVIKLIIARYTYGIGGVHFPNSLS